MLKNKKFYFWSWDAKQPFGHELPNETPTTGFAAFTFDLRFSGQIYDAETGLFHNGFRDYHSGLGRYVQSDPIGLDGGWNTYGYVGGNPLSGIDPLGLIQKDSYQKINRPNLTIVRGPFRAELEYGTMLTDKGNVFPVYKLISGDERYNLNCHGYALGANIWVENPTPVLKDEYYIVKKESEADLIYWEDKTTKKPLHTTTVNNGIIKNLGYLGAWGIFGLSGINIGKNGQLPPFLDPNLIHLNGNKTYYKKREP